MGYIDESNYQMYENAENNEKRPVGLIVLAVLTFIGSSIMALSYFVVFAMYDVLPDMIQQMGNTFGEPLSSIYKQSAETISSVSKNSFLLITLPYLLSIVGAGLMLAMRKLGFHLYVAAQVLVLTLPMLLLKEGFPIGGLFLSIAFVGLYFTFFKKMK